MKYKIGQDIMVKKASGGEGRYLYGGTLRDLPLGSKGQIVDYCFDHYSVHTNSGNFCLDQDEIGLDGKLQSEAQQKTNSFLENVLLLEESTSEIKTEHIELGENQKKKGVIDWVKKLFGYDSNKIRIGDSFEPQFNVREEFAIWVRNQFPKIEEYSNRGDEYKELNQRRQEVYNAAKLACAHGTRTTNTCVTKTFDVHLKKLRNSSNREFVFYLDNLVDWIELLAANLGTVKHYGTEKIRRY